MYSCYCVVSIFLEIRQLIKEVYIQHKLHHSPNLGGYSHGYRNSPYLKESDEGEEKVALSIEDFRLHLSCVCVRVSECVCVCEREGAYQECMFPFWNQTPRMRPSPPHPASFSDCKKFQIAPSQNCSLIAHAHSTHSLHTHTHTHTHTCCTGSQCHSKPTGPSLSHPVQTHTSPKLTHTPHSTHMYCMHGRP